MLSFISSRHMFCNHKDHDDDIGPIWSQEKYNLQARLAWKSCTGTWLVSPVMCRLRLEALSRPPQAKPSLGLFDGSIEPAAWALIVERPEPRLEPWKVQVQVYCIQNYL